MREQLTLIGPGAYLDQERWGRILDEATRVVEHVTHKEAAHALDVAPSLLSNALARRDRKEVRGPWFPYLLRVDNTQGLIGSLAECAGCDVVPRPRMSDEQWRVRMEQALEQLPEGVRNGILDMAGVRR